MKGNNSILDYNGRGQGKTLKLFIYKYTIICIDISMGITQLKNLATQNNHNIFNKHPTPPHKGKT